MRLLAFFGAGLIVSVCIFVFIVMPAIENLDLIRGGCAHTHHMSVRQELLCRHAQRMGLGR